MTRHDDLRYEPHLALALGGGGALGAAHVGVLQVLHERGITPSLVVGTSVGSIIGAAYAAQIDPYELEDLVLRANWGNFGTFSIAPSLGLLNTDGLRVTIENVVGDKNIENLPIRYGAIASDLGRGESLLLDHGPLYPAVAASISVPGIFAPTKLDGHRLLDGGLYENLPLEAAFEMGAKHVIGVRLAPEWDVVPSQHSSVKVHQLEIRSDVTLISPKLQHRSQWVNKDLPGLVQDGREAAERVLSDYEVIHPRAASVGTTMNLALPIPAPAPPAPPRESSEDLDFTEYAFDSADATPLSGDEPESASAEPHPELAEQPRGLAAFFKRH